MTERKDISRGDLLELKKVAELALSAYLKGKLPPKEVAQMLATHMELEAARDVLDQLAHDGRITREGG